MTKSLQKKQWMWRMSYCGQYQPVGKKKKKKPKHTSAFRNVFKLRHNIKF